MCWKDMVALYGFKSEAALHGVKNVSDHHKGWTLARIAHGALIKELMVPYVRNELAKPGANPDPLIGSDVPWLECPACNALTWVITVTE